MAKVSEDIAKCSVIMDMISGFGEINESLLWVNGNAIQPLCPAFPRPRSFDLVRGVGHREHGLVDLQVLRKVRDRGIAVVGLVALDLQHVDARHVEVVVVD